MTEPRLLKISDIPGAMRLKEAAGWNQTERDWLNVLAIEPEGCFCIECDGTLAATATAVCYGRDLAWIGMVLTAPAFRGRGFARRLMERAIEFARRRGVGWIKLDATDMGLPLYSSLGFEGEQPVERWLRPGRVPDASGWSADEKVEAPPMGLDRAAFGADRSAVLARVAVESYRTGNGYALGRLGAIANYFGPCVAESAEAARELLERFLERHPDENLFWDLLPERAEAAKMARAAGFEARRKLTRMSLRGRADAGPLGNDDARVFALAGLEFG